MTKLKFTPEMFANGDMWNPGFCNSAVKVAQHIYDEYLKQHGRIVYSAPGNHRIATKGEYGEVWIDSKIQYSVYRGVLIEIEEIEKKHCEHRPHMNGIGGKSMYPMCELCGVKIKASGWTECGE